MAFSSTAKRWLADVLAEELDWNTLAVMLGSVWRG
jgi:hypothetical protein